MKSVKQIFLEIFRPNDYKWILLLFSILLLPNIAGLFMLSDLEDSLFKKAAYLLFSVLILFVPALFLKLRYYFLLEGLFVLLAPLEIVHMYLNKMPITEGFISAIIHTNPGEAFEMLYSLKGICIIVGFIWFCYFLITFTRIKNDFLFTSKAKIIIAVMFIFFNLGLYGIMYQMAYKQGVINRFEYANDHFNKKYKKTYPADLLTVSYSLYSNQKKEKALQQELQHFSFGASKEFQTDKELYVVVIGESARYGNFSINGYERPTSPELEKNKEILSYKDVYATANLTEIALPLILTRATPPNADLGYKEKAFTDAFAEAGFSTAWIANQSSDSPFISRIAADSDYSFFSMTDFDAATNFDGNLLPHLDTVLNKQNPRQLIVIHTLGSHFRYNFRYPEAFKYFTPAMEGTMSYSVLSPSNKELLVNTYDNSIRYTDHILSSIINRVQEQQTTSAVIYISDHAENLYDDEKELVFHGGSSSSVYEKHIPLFLWTSEKYKQVYPQKQITLESNTGRSLSSSNFFHTILDLADIHYPGEELTASFASPLFREDSVRYLLMPDKRVIHFSKNDRND